MGGIRSGNAVHGSRHVFGHVSS